MPQKCCDASQNNKRHKPTQHLHGGSLFLARTGQARLNESTHLIDLIAAGGGSDFSIERCVKGERSGHHLVADGLSVGQTFAGDGGFVQEGGPGNDTTIDGNDFAGEDANLVAKLNVGG